MYVKQVSLETRRPLTSAQQPARDQRRNAPSRAQSYQSWSTYSPSEIEASKWQAAQQRHKSNVRGLVHRWNFRNVRLALLSCGDWSLKKKLLVFGGLAGFVLIWIIVIAAAASNSSGTSANDNLSSIHVTNPEAFSSGGASRESPFDANQGTEGKDEYTYYSGHADNFPPDSAWAAFDDLWKRNLPTIRRSCSFLAYGPDNSETDVLAIRSAIQDTAQASLVDHRFILATVMQESKGCVSVGGTTSSGGVFNPGLMQSHNGTSYSAARPRHSIYKMIRDGTQGTPYGDGLVQLLNKHGNVYEAARGYNSGSIAASGDLSDANGATACYVSDIANRLTGWVDAPSKCTEW